MSAYFSPIQHGVATEGGSELIVHHIQLLLEKNPDWIMVKTDISNAFNSVDRASLLYAVSDSFPDIQGHVHKMYGVATSLIYLKGSETILLSSQQGVYIKVIPWDHVLFSTAIQTILCRLQESHLECTILAYLDDVIILGYPDNVLATFEDLKSSLNPIGLSVCDHKT